MYKKTTLALLVSFFPFFIVKGSENKLIFQNENAHCKEYVYYNEDVKEKILNDRLYQWLHGQNPKHIQKISMHGNLDNIKIVDEYPDVNYEMSRYQEDILYTKGIFNCVGIEITAQLSDFLKKYLFHFNFAFREDISKNKNRLKRIINQLKSKQYEIEIAISSSYYSSNVFEILFLIKKCKRSINYYDIDPFYCCDPQESYITDVKNIFLLNVTFPLTNKTVGRGKNLIISREGGIFNASIPRDVSEKLIKKLYQDRKMWYQLRTILPLLSFDIVKLLEGYIIKK